MAENENQGDSGSSSNRSEFKDLCEEFTAENLEKEDGRDHTKGFDVVSQPPSIRSPEELRPLHTIPLTTSSGLDVPPDLRKLQVELRGAPSLSKMERLKQKDGTPSFGLTILSFLIGLFMAGLQIIIGASLIHEGTNPILVILPQIAVGATLVVIIAKIKGYNPLCWIIAGWSLLGFTILLCLPNTSKGNLATLRARQLKNSGDRLGAKLSLVVIFVTPLQFLFK
jgi:hypothetical protein